MYKIMVTCRGRMLGTQIGFLKNNGHDILIPTLEEAHEQIKQLIARDDANRVPNSPSMSYCIVGADKD